MATDNNLKPVKTAVSFPENTRTSGVAIAPDGSAWVAGRGVNAGSVFSIAPGDASKPVAHKLPADIPHDRGHAQPAHVALETKAGKVVAVWVSDLQTGFVYRLEPGDVAGAKAQKVDLGAGAGLHGIAWDEKRKLVWVADNGGRLLAIDTEKKVEKKELATSRPDSGVAHLAVTDNGIWFTEYEAGNVCFLDPSKSASDRIKPFNFNITTTDEDNHTTAASYPAGLAVDNNRVWVVAGLAGTSEGSLWFVDNISDLKNAALHRVASLGKESQPNDIAVDAAGYLWVTLSGGHKTVQLTNTGMLVEEYDLDKGSSPSGIAYAAPQDQIWICDAQKDHHRVLRLTPIDQIAPAKAGNIAISGNPAMGVVAPGEQLPKVTVSVLDDANQPLKRHVILTIDPPTVASFGGQSAAVVETDAAGHAAVEGVKAAAGTANGSPFTVRATTRGLQKPAVVYQGYVSQPITGIQTVDDVGETVTFGTDFKKNLVAKLTGPGGAHAEVVFRIENGAERAQFAQGQKGVKEYTTIAGADGIARAGLHSLDAPGEVSVSVHPKVMGDSLHTSFKPRYVVPLPDKIEGDKHMSLSIGQASKPYTITVSANKTPVPNVVVQVRIVKVTPGAKDVHFAKKGQPDDPKHVEERIQTDAKGQASIGGETGWHILSPSAGNVNVRFEVIEPTQSKASWEVHSHVNPEE